MDSAAPRSSGQSPAAAIEPLALSMLAESETTAQSATPSPNISRSASFVRPPNGLHRPAGGLDHYSASAHERSGLNGDVDQPEEISAPSMVLELADGTACQGSSFGAAKSVSGECVFQTGMVGYPESLTDPSYEGQILVLTYPLVGNYGVPSRDSAINSAQLPAYFESSRIHIAGLVVASYSGQGNTYSHHLATSELGVWLKEQGIPAICGVDTRALTKRIREHGVLLGKLLIEKHHGRGAGSFERTSSRHPRAWAEDYVDCPMHDPNVENLVARVSMRTPIVYDPATFFNPKTLPVPPKPLLHPSGRPFRVIAIDVGMKYNQIRCFLMRGIQLKCVPWNYDFLSSQEEPFDGLFISNGPGDPTTVQSTIERIRRLMNQKRMPIFGICLGHQLLGLAAGASTTKLKYGNRGANIPCTNMINGRCYVTSQNHGYAVDAATLPVGWKEMFVNANDGTNEGIFSTDLPYFSVQFHPESTPGPRDTEFLFDVFINNVAACAQAKQLVPIVMPGGSAVENAAKTPRVEVQKVLVLGSGGLSIGQAGEFDYSGSQAIKALKEEGIYTILINPNIATIQTSSGLADKVYFLPVTPEFVLKVIEHERPDGIYVTFGGQTALNVGIKLKDEFPRLGVRVLGTPIDTIITTEDRELFAQAMAQIGEKCAQSASATTVEDSVKAAETIGYPVIVRAAFALGGLGSGFASNRQELVELCTKAFATSPQVLIERSMKGWKEIEYEVVRDCRDNCITVCNMENFDPLGIHTGDSIVIAPSQTLSDADYNMLRTTAVNVIRHLGVVGECNIQYALNPNSQEYCIIEVNARLSRSSALASKATGYPLAFIAAKLGLNIPLNEIKNSVTKNTSACFEPSLDYCVVKIPRWDLRKFSRVSTVLGSSMKSVGEVMAIGRTFEETIQKAIRAIDPQFSGFTQNEFTDDIDYELSHPTDKRIFAIAEAMRKGYSVDKIWELSRIDKWFLHKLKRIVDLEARLSTYSASHISPSLLRHAKQAGFGDKQIAKAINSNELAVRRVRTEHGITPFVKQIDTVAAEFPCHTNYLYTTYNASENDVSFQDHGIMVIGSGVYRIGSSVEFDWCAVRCIRTLRERGYKTIMVNYNPETVSTDYDEADRLYFETITLETILDIYDLENSAGVIISVGGQTPNNIALPLHRQNVKILGTSPEMIDTAENRYKFSRMLDRIHVDQPLWKELTNTAEAHAFCDKVTYPVLVRPSYVLSGAAMNVVYSADDLSDYLSQAAEVSRDHPVVITKYIEEAKEIEMDAIAKDGKLVMHYISEHVENAGVHSGDATLILPPQDLDPETVARIEVATRKIANALNVTGPLNIQFIAKNNEIKVIECNLRAARSFPFVSKVTGVDAITLATDVMLGLAVDAYPATSMPDNYVGVKVPQFSFSRLAGADPILGVEMASTGEVACFGKDRYEAYLKALLAAGMKLPKKNILLSIGSFKEKMEILPSVQKLARMGYNIFATAGTADFLQEHDVPVSYLEALNEKTSTDQKTEYSLDQHLSNNLIDLYINLPSKNRFRRPASYMSKGYLSRRMAVDFAIPLVTNVKCAKLFIEAIARNPTFQITSIDQKSRHQTMTLPNLVCVNAVFPQDGREPAAIAADISKAAIRGGFTTLQILPALSVRDMPMQSVQLIASASAASMHCDWALAMEPAIALKEPIDGVNALALLLDVPDAQRDANYLSSCISAWPEGQPVVVRGSSADLATAILLASLGNRSIHIANVASKQDIELIALSKVRGVKVTCDVPVYALFFSTTSHPQADCLPTEADRLSLWNNMDSIDAFGVGSLPMQMAKQLQQPLSSTDGYEDVLPLLMSAVQEGRISIEAVIAKMSDNPRAIFGLDASPDSYVEVEMGSPSRPGKANRWSPLANAAGASRVHRVVLHGETVYLDGVLSSKPGLGQNAVEAKISLPPRTRRKSTRFSMSMSTKPVINADNSMPRSPTFDPRTMKSPILAPVRGEMASLLPDFGDASRPGGLLPSPFTAAASTPPPTQLVAAFHRRHILTVKQFNRNDLHALFNIAHEMRIRVERNNSIDLLRGRVLVTLFFEASTRTSTSFEAAMLRLGGTVAVVTADKSSVTKGESLPDTIRTVGCYADAIVLRHPEIGSAQVAAKFSPIPIINGGDGAGEHPTQAMLDVYTIREELGTVNGLTVTLVGDLKYGRTVHSLVRLLTQYQVSFIFVSPPSLCMPDAVKVDVRKAGMSFRETADLQSVIAQTDVLYVTRVQGERFADPAEYERVKNTYIVNSDLLTRAKSHMAVMHPLPRNAEIDPEVDFDGRAAYFRQMKYGLYLRMALLSQVLAQ